MEVVKRFSKQRAAILSELSGVTCHPTADEVYEMTRKIIPNISLGTVYRNLNNLEKEGAILKFVIGGKEHFDANITPHIHLCCENCGEIKDVFDETASIQAEIKKINSFKVNNIIINGVCNECC